ncbi:hypothetical protein VTH8203_00828 [Vibrio thalassae]|uniref:Uncharacterized protein n=1 Tax=Vibrio thalassae TaxID=1243014 RepID=A0A240EEX6_9VIBR|nr:hypothetical protein [Vibrio thalassae]SNX47227.1 hypothetical protein VTH8203_00828 [Vibrio thalassae]
MAQLTLDVDIDAPDKPESVYPRTTASRRKKVVKKCLSKDDLMVILFPEEFPQDYLEWLMNTDTVNWTSKDVYLVQTKLVKDVFDILRRKNSSISSINEALVWLFCDDRSDYDFTASKVAESLGVRLEVIQTSMITALSATLREHKRAKKVNVRRVETLTHFVAKAKSYMENSYVKLTATEFFAQYT